MEPSKSVTLGGSIDQDALFLLDGIDEGTGQRVTIPIAHLPVVLGRQHDSNESNFVSLGSSKQISRKHIGIEYRLAVSKSHCGSLERNEGTFEVNKTNLVEVKTIQRKRPANSTGFTLTCLGKNRVVVNKQRIDPQQTCWLTSQSAIKVGSLCLYFLLPTTESSTTLLVSDDEQEPPKRKMSVSTAQPTVASSLVAKKPRHATKIQDYQNELNDMSTLDLLEKLQEGTDESIWDRRLQMLGGVLAGRAVMDAGRALLENQADTFDFSRGEIMDWIETSSVYRSFVTNMLKNMEAKSYQSCITKALVKAGFERTKSHGRYVKWAAPDELRKGGTTKSEQSTTMDDAADD